MLTAIAPWTPANTSMAQVAPQDAASQPAPSAPTQRSKAAPKSIAVLTRPISASGIERAS